ncbi:MAG: flagellar biosynthesis anti-sigma factor FlgM [Caulobacteraceae bacterium]
MGFNVNKIGGVNEIYKSQKVESKKGVSEVPQARGKKDELQISKEAMDFQLVMKAAKAAQSIPDIREEVIAPIKEKLENGTYEVDGKSIADKILSRQFNIKI